jgi:glutaredoxin
MRSSFDYRHLGLAVACSVLAFGVSAEERCRRADGVGVPCSWLPKQQQQPQKPPSANRQSTTSVEAEPRETQWQPQEGELVLFAADWCPHCRAARAYLRERSIEYTEYNIETRAGKSVFREAGGGGIPLLVLGEKSIRGYSDGAYDWFLWRKRK